MIVSDLGLYCTHTVHPNQQVLIVSDLGISILTKEGKLKTVSSDLGHLDTWDKKMNTGEHGPYFKED